MKKNLMSKMISSRMQKDKQYQSGTWLYSADGVQGYVTPDGQFMDLRPEEDEHENETM